IPAPDSSSFSHIYLPPSLFAPVKTSLFSPFPKRLFAAGHFYLENTLASPQTLQGLSRIGGPRHRAADDQIGTAGPEGLRRGDHPDLIILLTAGRTNARRDQKK